MDNGTDPRVEFKVVVVSVPDIAGAAMAVPVGASRADFLEAIVAGRWILLSRI